MAAATGTALAIAGGAQILGGVIGNMASAGDRERAQDAYQRALAEIESIGAPPDLAKEIFFNNFQQVGVLTPEMEEAIHLEAPKVAEIKESPELKKARMDALLALRQTSRTGYDAKGRADLALGLLQAQRAAEAEKQATLQSRQRQGAGSAGDVFAAQLASGSAMSAQAGELGLKAAASQQEAKGAALNAFLRAASEETQSQFNRDLTRAQSLDQQQLQKFNEAVGRQQRNVAARTQAQQYNLGAQQRIAEANVEQRNRELLRQREGQARQYELGLRRAEARSGAQRGMGGQYQQQAGQTAGMWSGIGAGAGRMIGAAYSGAGKGTSPTPPMDEAGYDYGSGQEGAGGGGDYRMNRGDF